MHSSHSWIHPTANHLALNHHYIVILRHSYFLSVEAVLGGIPSVTDILSEVGLPRDRLLVLQESVESREGRVGLLEVVLDPLANPVHILVAIGQPAAVLSVKLAVIGLSSSSGGVSEQPKGTRACRHRHVSVNVKGSAKILHRLGKSTGKGTRGIDTGGYDDTVFRSEEGNGGNKSSCSTLVLSLQVVGSDRLLVNRGRTSAVENSLNVTSQWSTLSA